MSNARALFGAVALSGVNAARLALQLIMVPLMARLLGPSAYGVIAIALPFILISNLLCDAGLGAALVRQLTPSRELESTVFWLAVGIGAILSGVICAVAAPLASAFSVPVLSSVLIALSPILIISSALSVTGAKIARERRFDLFAVGDFISVALSTAAALTAALYGWGVWSLVAQQLTLWASKAAWLIPASGFRPKLFCDVRLAAPFVGFSVNVVGADLADFAGRSLPSVVVGALLGVAAAGQYTMALQLTRLPELVVDGVVSLSMFTAVALTGEDRRAAAQLTLKGVRLVLLITAPVFCGLALVADVAVPLLLGPKWGPAAGAIALLCPSALLLSAYTFCGAVLMGVGRSDRKFALTLLIGVACLTGAAAGARYGVRGVAVGLSLAALLALPFYVRSLATELQLRLSALASAASGPLIAALGMGVVVLGLKQAGQLLPPWLQLSAAVAGGVVSYGGLVAVICGRQVLQDLRPMLPAAWQRRPAPTPAVIQTLEP